MADYNTKNYKEVGGDRQTLAPGGSIKFGSVIFTVNATGDLVISDIPTTEPAAVGALYSNAGVLTISNGP